MQRKVIEKIHEKLFKKNWKTAVKESLKSIKSRKRFDKESLRFWEKEVMRLVEYTIEKIKSWQELRSLEKCVSENIQVPKLL